MLQKPFMSVMLQKPHDSGHALGAGSGVCIWLSKLSLPGEEGPGHLLLDSSHHGNVQKHFRGRAGAGEEASQENQQQL